MVINELNFDDHYRFNFGNNFDKQHFIVIPILESYLVGEEERLYYSFL